MVQTVRASLIMGASGLVLLAAALAPSFVGAQSSDDETPEPTASATPESGADQDKDGGAFGEGCGPRAGVLLFGIGEGGEDLAEALGVSEEDLRAAMRAAHEALGEFEPPQSEEEAEARGEEFKAAVASELGVTVDEFEAAIEEANEARTAALIERIETAVAAGDLSRERADEMIERIESGERPLPRPFRQDRGVPFQFGGTFEGTFEGHFESWGGEPSLEFVPAFLQST